MSALEPISASGMTEVILPFGAQIYVYDAVAGWNYSFVIGLLYYLIRIPVGVTMFFSPFRDFWFFAEWAYYEFKTYLQKYE